MMNRVVVSFAIVVNLDPAVKSSDETLPHLECTHEILHHSTTAPTTTNPSSAYAAARSMTEVQRSSKLVMVFLRSVADSKR